MSRKNSNKNKPQEQSEPVQVSEQEQLVDAVREMAKKMPPETVLLIPGGPIAMQTTAEELTTWVPKHKRCPICWGMHKGQGVQYARYPIKQTKYFKCQNCAHTWSAVIVEHVKEINERIPEDLSER